MKSNIDILIHNLRIQCYPRDGFTLAHVETSPDPPFLLSIFLGPGIATGGYGNATGGLTEPKILLPPGILRREFEHDSIEITEFN